MTETRSDLPRVRAVSPPEGRAAGRSPKKLADQLVLSAPSAMSA